MLDDEISLYDDDCPWVQIDSIRRMQRDRAMAERFYMNRIVPTERGR